MIVKCVKSDLLLNRIKTVVISRFDVFDNIEPEGLLASLVPYHVKRKRNMKQVTSMMAGVVLEVLVKAGDQVSDGQEVAILESMKMQLPVQSTLAGKVSAIKVTNGDFVNEGDAILDLE